MGAISRIDLGWTFFRHLTYAGLLTALLAGGCADRGSLYGDDDPLGAGDYGYYDRGYYDYYDPVLGAGPWWYGSSDYYPYYRYHRYYDHDHDGNWHGNDSGNGHGAGRGQSGGSVSRGAVPWSEPRRSDSTRAGSGRGDSSGGGRSSGGGNANHDGGGDHRR